MVRAYPAGAAMRPYLHPRDEALASVPGTQVRRLGKSKRKPWKVEAVAKLAPSELDDQPESVIHDQIERDIQATGLPYIDFRERLYFWLKRQAEMHWQARELLDILKDFPDFAVFKPLPGELWCYCLLLELKTIRGKASKGQRRLSGSAGGYVAKGYTDAKAAVTRFASRSPEPAGEGS